MNMKKSWAIVPTTVWLLSLGTPFAVEAETDGEKSSSQTFTPTVGQTNRENQAIQPQADEVVYKTIDEWIPKNQRLATRVAEELNIGFSQKISQEKLYSLKGLYMDVTDMNGQYSLEGIEVLKGLTSFTILGGAVDYSPLAELTNLTALNFNLCDIPHLDFAKNLKKLWRLEAHSAGITDIEGIRNLPNLGILYLSGNSGIQDLSPLGTLNNLYDVELGGLPLKDLSLLEDKTGIRYLDIGGTQITDLTGIEKLTKLEELRLSQTSIRDFSPLKDLKLTFLSLLSMGLDSETDFSPLFAIETLETLGLSDNNISTPPSFKALANLKSISLSRNNITDASFVNDLPLNATVNLQQNQILDLSVIQDYEKRTDLRLQNQRVVLPARYVRGDDAFTVNNLLIQPDGTPFDIQLGGSTAQIDVGGLNETKTKLQIQNLEKYAKQVVYNDASSNYGDYVGYGLRVGKFNGSVVIPIQFAEDQVVQLDLDGGTSHSKKELLVFPGKLIPEPEQPIKPGYIFTGWSQVGEEETSNWDFQKQVMPNAPLKLKATWQMVSYRLTYDANTSEAVEGLPADQVFTVEELAVVSAVTPTREGYTFTGWNTKADGTGTEILPETNWTTLMDTTLYAQWKADTIIVDPFPDPDPKPQPVPDPQPVPQPEPTPIPQTSPIDPERGKEAWVSTDKGSQLHSGGKEKEGMSSPSNNLDTLPQTGGTPIRVFAGILGLTLLGYGLRKILK
ncbi:Internalin A [Listeria floridensis FSL S10-1187]|uniref:Internalin A n=1 Tax=Listeria floridensis FSL S10-1187 TaxID=1265817 RepID=A0ABN0RBG7_9LIST|nr:InlB B-repeat-containing protein [Listeria floridensis]EUJ25472.1 Internalin A [Listeria floridensis FSL S10-1187]